VGIVKRLVLGSFAAVIVAASCGRSVDLGGKHNDEQDGGAAGYDDGTGGFSGAGLGGNSFGGTAGDASAGTAGDGSAGAGLGGNSFGGTAGDASAGTAGDGSAGTGLGGNSFGGTAGDGSSGAGLGGNSFGGAAGAGLAGGGGGPVPSTLPTCITDLYDACWPEGACRDDAGDATRCYDSGVTIVTEPLVGGCSGGATKRYHKPDGSPCFSFMSGAFMGQACENYFQLWYDATGNVVADQTTSFLQPPKLYPTCFDEPTTPCDASSGRCSWPSTACTPGNCDVTPD